ncbi:MAG: hypothetical protein QF515_00925 [Pseudomonadales bacterium]|nr:hypothetical protein [Pseudomonadales bacterium]MDP6825672.1 hypothetical protein [Pseudomonadales bacterium]
MFQCLYAFIELGVAHELNRKDTTPCASVAERLDLNPDTLYRLLCACTLVDLVREQTGGRFRLTTIGHSCAAQTRAARSDARIRIRPEIPG